MNLGKRFFEQKLDVQKIPGKVGTKTLLHNELLAKESISSHLLSMLPMEKSQPIVIMCIGTDRSTGDSLGPLTGTFLEEKGMVHFHIYGTLDDPIHAVNLEEKLKIIQESHPNPFIIAIDACLGKLKSVGMIQIVDGPVKPGAGVKKELPYVGNMHITGIVNVSGFMEFYVLQNTRLNLVVKIAKTISGGIYRASITHRNQLNIPDMDWNKDQEQTL